MSINAESTLVAQNEHREITVSVRLLDGPPERVHHIKVPGEAPLIEVLRRGAEALHLMLLPDKENPLDQLHHIDKHGVLEPALSDLADALDDFLGRSDRAPDFGIEAVRAFRVNTRWAIAPQPELTPRQILAIPAIGLDHTQYTLYAIGRTMPLSLDTAVPIQRGEAFEAQRDGKYGAA
jgi:hypothetical protein